MTHTPRIRLGSIDVHHLSGASHIHVGTNYLNQFSDDRKVNEGFGSANNTSRTRWEGNVAALYDVDQFDAWRNRDGSKRKG